ncbi:MAG: FAD-dependent oxidoreductase [Candidatus Thiodiazotropha sp. 6PLUC2]
MTQTTTHRIGIVGSGIAGLSAAWLLRNKYQVDLYEQNDYVGGHTHTVEVEEDGKIIPIDTGFIVYNEPNYPLLTQLFRYMDVETQNTDMSFAVSVDKGRLEYAGDNLGKLFAQKRNIIDIKFLSMLREIVRFNRDCLAYIEDNNHDLSLGDFLDQNGYNQQFRYDYLLPMAAAIWSCPTRTMLSFPFSSFARFFNNHGLISLKNRPQWKTVVNGSWQYVKKMSAALGSRIKVKQQVVRIKRLPDGVEVITQDGQKMKYDNLILACHADQAVSLLDNPKPLEAKLLNKFRYQENIAYLHSDSALMPKSRKVWSSWNYLSDDKHIEERDVSVSYWMNRLQRLDSKRDYFVSLNPLQSPRDECTVATITYDHPVFDSAALYAQEMLDQIQGKERIWYCGSYFGYGFHEDALRSSVELASRLGVSEPWMTENRYIPYQNNIDKLASLARSAGV